MFMLSGFIASFMVRHQQCNLDFLLFSLQLLRKSWIRVCRVSRIDWPQCFFVVFCTNIKWKRLTELLRQFLDLPPWQCVIVIMLIKWPSSFALLSFVFFLSPLCLSLIRSCYSAPHSAASLEVMVLWDMIKEEGENRNHLLLSVRSRRHAADSLTRFCKTATVSVLGPILKLCYVARHWLCCFLLSSQDFADCCKKRK